MMNTGMTIARLTKKLLADVVKAPTLPEEKWIQDQVSWPMNGEYAIIQRAASLGKTISLEKARWQASNIVIRLAVAKAWIQKGPYMCHDHACLKIHFNLTLTEEGLKQLI